MNKCTKGFIIPGKMNMIFDGQFGSTGKGLIAAKIATDNHIDISCTRLSPNAGHTFYYNNKKYVTKLLPVSSILQDRNTIYIGFGSVLNLDIFFKEIEEFNIDPNRIIIHPRVAIITNDDLALEQKLDGVITIASTQSGSGAARSSKIMRSNPLAQGIPELREFIRSYDLKYYLDKGCNIFAETGQGFDLSINMGYAYPYCTSIDVTPSAILADFGLHPRYMGNSMMSIRTFPIRVGNPTDNNGNDLGCSGPVYDDSEEISWDELCQPCELTTITKRIRRVFTFSKKQYERSLYILEPSHIFLNFINYIRPEDIEIFRFKDTRKPTYVGYGPYTNQIVEYNENIIDQYMHCSS